MQLIAADIGNNSIKLAVHADPIEGRWCDQYVYGPSQPIQLDLARTPAIWAISSVNSSGLDRLNRWIKEHRTADRIHLISQQEVPIKTNVSQRSRVGCDRLLGAWAALKLCDNQGPLVVIDLGTAVTTDFVNEYEVFEGGLIFPGAQTSLAYLSHAADALPDLSSPEQLKMVGNLDRELFGRDTETAMLLGVYQALLGGLRHIVERMTVDLEKNCPVYVTGGGALALEKYLPPQWKLVPDLVLRGAREIGMNLLREHAT